MHLEGKNWMQTLAQDAGKPLLTCTEGVQPIELEADGQKVNDPHTWFTPRNAAIYVNNIVRGVSRLDPAHKADYEARARLYLQQLRVLDSWIREQFNSIPVDSRILVTSHDAFNYFAKEYGFKNQAPVGWSTGAEVGAGMTPERRKQVIESIKSFRVKAVFVETSKPEARMQNCQRSRGKNRWRALLGLNGSGRVCRRVIHWNDARERTGNSNFPQVKVQNAAGSGGSYLGSPDRRTERLHARAGKDQPCPIL
jgi:manganese/iron transport system substrate-binding protein